MLKLRSMMEDVAEKLFGRFLPKVEARANGCNYILQGCCGPQNNNALVEHSGSGCPDPGPGVYCYGLCPL